ncbi:MAG TPA: hypothetical protein ENK91_01570, partial [Bacteroidetes bacterium]|nr:hypothetical protein [Bacteroidota bacterium]
MKKQLLYIFIIFLPFFIQGQTELCTNGIDDDGDGLIDLFDPDCPCSDSAYQAYCSVNCEYLPDSFPDFKMKLKWETGFLSDSVWISPNIVIGDVDGDDTIEMISSNSFGYGFKQKVTNGISVFNGRTGKLERYFNYTG